MYEQGCHLYLRCLQQKGTQTFYRTKFAILLCCEFFISKEKLYGEGTQSFGFTKV